MQKKCSKCNQIKALDDFHNDGSRKDGKTSACKVCRTKHTVNYHKENQTWKTESYKQYNKKRMASPKAKQKACHSSTKWFYANHAKTVPYNRAYAAFKRIEQRYPKAIECSIEEVLPIYKQAYMMELATGIHHQIDHKRPLQAGGKHHPKNLAILSEEEHKVKTIGEYELIEQLLTEYYATREDT